VRPLATLVRAKRDAQVPVLPSDAAATAAAAAAAAAGSAGGASAPPAAASPPGRGAARARTFLVTAFHPELTDSPGWHRYFARMVEEATGRALLPRAPGGAGEAGAVGDASSSAEPGLACDAVLPVDFDPTSKTSGNAGSLLIARRVVPTTAPTAFH
jgi:hypothetical protein